jgi:hypothetical protein
MQRYALHGLSIDSELPLGTAVNSPGPCDLTLVMVDASDGVGNDPPGGDVIAELILEGRRLYTGVVDGDRYVLRLHGTCDFVMSKDLSRVACHSLASTEPELLSLLARGALMAFLLGLKGSCVLHASAVEVDRGSVVFVGGSGMGKSTLAGLACRDGARFVSDDLVHISDGPEPSWVGGASELRLRNGASPLADHVGDQWRRRTTVDDRVGLKPPMTTQAEGKLGAIVIPAPTRREPELSFHRLDPFDAAFALSAFPRMQWTLPKALGAQFDGVTRLAASVPVYRVQVPWGPPFADGLGMRIIDRVLADPP